MVEYDIPEVLLSEEPPNRNLFVLDDSGLPIQFSLLDLYSEGNTPAFDIEAEHTFDIWNRLEIINKSGGELIRGDAHHEICLAVRKKDEKFQEPILKLIREYAILMKRDVFDIKFIYDSLAKGNLVNLERYRITSIFEEYDLNDILSRKISWSSLNFKEIRERSDNIFCNLFEASNDQLLSSEFINDLDVIFNDEDFDSAWSLQEENSKENPNTPIVETESEQVLPNSTKSAKRKRISQVSSDSLLNTSTKRPMFSSTPKLQNSEEILNQLLTMSSDNVTSPIVSSSPVVRSVESIEQSPIVDPRISRTIETSLGLHNTTEPRTRTVESSPDMLYPTPPSRTGSEIMKSKITSLIKTRNNKKKKQTSKDEQAKKIAPVEFSLGSDSEDEEPEVVFQRTETSSAKISDPQSSDTEFEDDGIEAIEVDKQTDTEYFTAPEY